jgi:hypothetical protein
MLGMRTLILTAVVTMIAATIRCDVRADGAESKAPKEAGEGLGAAEIPSDLLAALQHDLKEDELEDVKSCLERHDLSWNEILRVTRLDLNRSRQAWLVEGLGPCLAGNATT